MFSAMNNTLVLSDENHDAEIISISTIFVFLSLLEVIARLASRRIKHVPFAVDDWLLVAAWVESHDIYMKFHC